VTLHSGGRSRLHRKLRHGVAFSWPATEICGLVHQQHLQAIQSCTSVDTSGILPRTPQSNHSRPTTCWKPSSSLVLHFDRKKMPPTRPRALDDSRSEASSTIGNIKDRNTFSAATGSGVSKNKRTILNSHNAGLKPSVISVTVTGAGSEEAGPSLPRVGSTSLFRSISPI
jgi:hypothetical protein